MRKRSRIGRVICWVALIFCILIGGLWAFSSFWGFYGLWTTSTVPFPQTTTQPVKLYPANSVVLIDGKFAWWEGFAAAKTGRELSIPRTVAERTGLLGLLVSMTRSYTLGFIPPRGMLVAPIVIPLWLPLGIVGLPLIISEWIAWRRRRVGVQLLDHRWTKRRGPNAVRAVLSIPFLLIALIGVAFFMEWFSTRVLGIDDFVGEVSRTMQVREDLVAAGFVGVWLFLSWCVWRFIYFLLSWTRVGTSAVSDDGAPVCPMCHYNLTGNTTCICPECGGAVADVSNIRAL